MFLGKFCLLKQDFFAIGVSHSVLRSFCSHFPQVKCPNFLDFWNPWRKIIKRSCLRCKNLAHKGCKSAAAKKKFFRFFHLFTLFKLNVFLPPFPEVQCQNFFDFMNPWGKVMQRRGLRFETFA